MRGDRGEYKCEIHFQGQVQTRRTTVSIQAAITDYNPPRLTSIYPKQITAIVDDAILLPCHGYDRSPDTSNVEIVWLFGNVTLSPSHYLLRSGAIQIVGHGNLYISRVQSKHAGSYKCIASNQNGKVEKKIELDVKGKIYLISYGFRRVEVELALRGFKPQNIILFKRGI